MQRGKGRRHGQALVEFAIVLPILLLVLLGIIEFARVFFIYTNLFNAAREGVRYGITQPRDYAGIQQQVLSKISLVPREEVAVRIWYDKGPGTDVFTDPSLLVVGDRVVVDLQYTTGFVTPLFQPLSDPFEIHTRAARTIQTLGRTQSDPLDDVLGEASVSISVTAEPPMIYEGDTVQFTYTVVNAGEVDLFNVILVDNFGNSFNLGTLPAGETVVHTISLTPSENTTVVATVDGSTPFGQTVSATDEATVVVIHPDIQLTVSADPEYVTEPGTAVDFTFAVQNTGDITLTNVVVADSLGASTTPIVLSPDGVPIIWVVSHPIWETTTNDVTVSGQDPLGGIVTASGSVTVVYVEEMAPIYIDRPLLAGDVSVSGTAEPDQDVCIRDLMDTSFPILCTTVQPDGTFRFDLLPPLEPGHVIEVSGYGRSDSAVVTGELADIVIDEPLCHGSTVISGTAQPGRSVTIVITDTTGYLYQDGTIVGSDGHFLLPLPTDQPLQTGQTVQVSGYGKSDAATVQGCTTDAYIVIAPQCAAPGETTIQVRGYNWDYQNRNDYVRIFWDGDLVAIVEALDQPSEWETAIPVDLTEGTHTVSAFNRRTPEVSATLKSPCPMPNLAVTSLELITSTEVISTYQPLDFRVTVANLGDRAANSLFWVDLYSADPISRPVAWAAVSSLDAGASIPMTITFQHGFEVTGTFPVWAVVDSLDQVMESEEDDNTSTSITVTVSAEGTPPAPPPSGTSSIVGETWISLAGSLSPYPRVAVRVTGCGVDLITYSDENAAYSTDSLPACTYTVVGETWINGERYSNTYQVTVEEDETVPLIIILYKN
ncbi:MAG TPA: hypothetical protein ENK08_03370 [Chloroflexi bacterium]|nr:hypothetical protein [Chloroflexota bacterium]